jgi:hypothetical protein
VNPLAVSIAALNLQDGTLTFVDPSVTPPVTLVLNHLAVRIGEFSSADSPAASVTVDAETGNAAHLQISGETNPIGAQRETSLRALVRNGSILPLSPYAETYLGYELQAGELSLDVSFHMSSRAISAQTTLEITHFAFGRQAESENATKLPIRLVVFLLTDSSGKITLRLPLERGLDNSPFDLRKTIVDAVLRPFQETARFPFTVLSGVPGSESGELGVQEFLPGSAELEPRETGKLDVIRRGLQRWPELMLDVEGSVDAADETADPHFLAVERADAVKEYLLRDGAMDPGRIFLIDNGPANVAEKGSRAFLSLKDRYRAVVDVGAGVEGKR